MDGIDDYDDSDNYEEEKDPDVNVNVNHDYFLGGLISSEHYSPYLCQCICNLDHFLILCTKIIIF